MRPAVLALLVAGSGALLIGVAPISGQPASLIYQNRGFYSEGVKDSASTSISANLYLISATVDYAEPYSSLPATFRARFYLPPGSSRQVNLTVRELDPAYHYWLDEVRPQSGWAVGVWNPFEWSTGAVVRLLNYQPKGPLSLSQLGAVARLEPGMAGKTEKVLPVALFHSASPQSADSYVFVFYPDRDMRLKFTTVREGGVPTREAQTFPHVPHNQPLPIKIGTVGWMDGWYILSISGSSEYDTIDEIVRFYHHRDFKH